MSTGGMYSYGILYYETKSIGTSLMLCDLKATYTTEQA